MIRTLIFLLLFPLTLFSQQKEITINGTTKSKTEDIYFAHVTFQDTDGNKFTTISDENAKYSITLKEGTYEVLVWTDFIEHMNSIVESMVYSEGSYWGEPDRFKFRTKIDDFQNTTDLQVETDRIVRTSFTITMFGYLVPDVLVKNLSKQKSNKTNSVQQLNVQFNTDADAAVFQDQTSLASGPSMQVTPVTPSSNILPSGGVSAEVLTYLNTNSAKTATTVTPSDTALFTGASFLAAPSGLPATSATSFQFFINGQHVEPAAITSFVDNGNATCTLTVDTAQLGFTLISTDEIVAVGKFG